MKHRSILTFLISQSGAVTVEKAVIVAGVIGLVIAASNAISQNTKILAKQTTGAMVGSHNTSNFESVLSVQPDFESWASNYYANQPIDGWTSVKGSVIELVTTRYPPINDKVGHSMIDLENDPYNSGIKKTFDFLKPNTDTLITVSAFDLPGGNGFDVMQNGQIVGSATNIPDTLETYVFNFTTGSNPQTEISIVPHGRDAMGAYVGTVQVSQ